MIVRMSIKDAKRLGYSIKGYEIIKGKKTPQPVLKKAIQRKKRKTEEKSKEKIPLIKNGNVYRLDFNSYLI